MRILVRAAVACSKVQDAAQVSLWHKTVRASIHTNRVIMDREVDRTRREVARMDRSVCQRLVNVRGPLEVAEDPMLDWIHTFKLQMHAAVMAANQKFLSRWEADLQAMGREMEK